MKPDEVTCQDMTETEISPSDLFERLGLLVVESRVPYVSAKGHVQGPHCPYSSSDGRHMCATSNFMCKRADAMRQQMAMLWKNKIPMCIEVLLYRKCSHGKQQAMSLDFSLPTHQDHCTLLEQWNIQALPCRSGDNSVRPRELIEAVKSYLYFSQLSSWLNSCSGAAPFIVCYRISPPGEFCTSSFFEKPVTHTFPVSLVARNLCLKITTAALTRRSDFLALPCPECSPKCISRKQQHGHKLSPPSTTGDIWPNHQFLLPDDESSGKSPPPEATTPPMQQVTHMKYLPTTIYPSPSCISDMPHALHLVQSPNECDYASGAIPKRKHIPRSPTWSVESHPNSAPTMESHEDMGRKYIPKESPKVLMSKKSSVQTYYSKEETKPVWTLSKPNLSNVDSTDSDHSSPDIDNYLKNLRTNCMDPLSPEEIKTYLAGLSTRDRYRSPLARDNELTSFTKTEIIDTQLEDDGVKRSPIRDLTKSFNTMTVSKAENTDRVVSKHRTQSPLSQLIASTEGNSQEANGALQNKVRKDNSSMSSPASDKSLNINLETNRKQEVAKNGVLKQDSSKLDSARSYNHDTSMMVTNGAEQEPCHHSTETNGIKKVHQKEMNGSHTDTTIKQGTQEKDDQDAVQFRIGEDDEEEDEDKSKSVRNGAKNSVAHSKSPKPDRSHQNGSINSPKPRMKKSLSESGCNYGGLAGFSKGNQLLKTLMKRDLNSHCHSPEIPVDQNHDNTTKPIPTPQERAAFRKSLGSSTAMLFHSASGLPLQSSPAPIKKRNSSCFEFDKSLVNVRAIKSSISCVNLKDQNKAGEGETDRTKFYSTSAPASTNSLLGNFEESLLNGRIEPTGIVDGFRADIGASGSFCPQHVKVPVTAFFFKLSDDNAPSPYLGHVNLEAMGRRGYHVPKKGTVQLTLFNPNNTVVKMFVVMYDMSDMPPHCQTFLRQRTLYMPVKGSASDVEGQPIFLRYLIHLRFASSKSGKIYLHTDIRIIFARDKLEYDSRVANYELRSFTEGPINPKFSPRK